MSVTTTYDIMAAMQARLIAQVTEWLAGNTILVTSDFVEIEVTRPMCFILRPQYSTEGFAGGLVMRRGTIEVMIVYNRMVDRRGESNQKLEKPLDVLCESTVSALNGSFLPVGTHPVNILTEPLQLIAQDPPVEQGEDMGLIKVTQRYAFMVGGFVYG